MMSYLKAIRSVWGEGMYISAVVMVLYIPIVAFLLLLSGDHDG